MRSQNFIKHIVRFEVARPIFWILSLSVLIQVFQSDSTSLFGVDRENSMDAFALGFSPERPFRSFMLPWLFSGLVHMSWAHLAQNATLLVVVYFFMRKRLSKRNWWLLVLSIQLALNFCLLAVSRLQSPTSPAHLYLGLSGICCGILGFAALDKSLRLRIAAVIATLYEIYRLTQTIEVQHESYVHLIALAVGCAIGVMSMHRRVLPAG